MSILKKLLFWTCGFLIFATLSNLSAHNIKEEWGGDAQSKLYTPQAIDDLTPFLELLGKIGPKIQDKEKVNGFECIPPDTVCDTLSCCSTINKYKNGYSCSQVCGTYVPVWCSPGGCPKGYEAKCVLGCPFKDTCSTVCPCLLDHCS